MRLKKKQLLGRPSEALHFAGTFTTGHLFGIFTGLQVLHKCTSLSITPPYPLLPWPRPRARRSGERRPRSTGRRAPGRTRPHPPGTVHLLNGRAPPAPTRGPATRVGAAHHKFGSRATELADATFRNHAITCSVRLEPEAVTSHHVMAGYGHGRARSCGMSGAIAPDGRTCTTSVWPPPRPTTGPPRDRCTAPQHL